MTPIDRLTRLHNTMFLFVDLFLKSGKSFNRGHRGSDNELVVKVYNINKGRNADMVNRCSSLSGYSELVAEIEENKKSMGLAAAVKTAVRSCMSRNILVYFLKEHSAEVENMLLTEWNWDDAKAVWQEEAKEEALKEGIEIGKIEGKIEERQQILDLFRQGYSLNEVEQLLTASPQLQAN